MRDREQGGAPAAPSGAAATPVTAPAVPARPGPVRRFEVFEAYRGLAALLVVVFHGYQYTGEPYQTGGPAAPHLALHNLDSLVDLFFVLSAFLLTLPWVRASVDGRPAQSARGYLVRRAIRILPVYWVAILTIWAVRNPSLPGNWQDLLEHLTFTQVFDSERIFYTIGPAWSLADEVMFYVFLLVVGLLLHRLCGRVASRAARLACWTAVPVLMVAATCWWTAWSLDVRHVPADNWATWFGPAAKAGVFAMGMLLAVLYVALPAGTTLRGPWPAVLRCAGLAGAAAVAVWRGPGAGGPHEEWTHLPFAAALAVLLAGSVFAAPGSRWDRLLACAPLTTLGLISYSVYLWHEPLLLLLGSHGWVLTKSAGSFIPGTALLVVLSLLAGWLSYWCIEYPVAALRERIDGHGRLRDLFPDHATGAPTATAPASTADGPGDRTRR